MTISNSQLREDWLIRAVGHLESIFQRSGYQIPMVKVSIGIPSTGAKSMHLGQCWRSKSSEDGINQIFIAPNQSDPVEVLDTLTHELVHAVDDVHHKNGLKNDCRPENLICLCIKCHSEQPLHGHIKNLPEYNQFIKQFISNV